jgi:hypothetical protein
MKNLLIASLFVLVAVAVYRAAAANTVNTGYTTPLEIQHYPTVNPQQTSTDKLQSAH